MNSKEEITKEALPYWNKGQWDPYQNQGLKELF